jgi:hypothetical protein
LNFDYWLRVPPYVLRDNSVNDLPQSSASWSECLGTPDWTGNEMLERARALFGEMQREYASGNFARYGELLQQLGKLLQLQ